MLVEFMEMQKNNIERPTWILNFHQSFQNFVYSLQKLFLFRLQYVTFIDLHINSSLSSTAQYPQLFVVSSCCFVSAVRIPENCKWVNSINEYANFVYTQALCSFNNNNIILFKNQKRTLNWIRCLAFCFFFVFGNAFFLRKCLRFWAFMSKVNSFYLS